MSWTKRFMKNSKKTAKSQRNKHQCPICHKALSSETVAGLKRKTRPGKFLPFCSEKCKLIDFGAWLDADYKIISKDPLDEFDNSRQQ